MHSLFNTNMTAHAAGREQTFCAKLKFTVLKGRAYTDETIRGSVLVGVWCIPQCRKIAQAWSRADLVVFKGNVYTEQAIRGDVFIGVRDAQAPQSLRDLLMQLADAPALPDRCLPDSQGTFQQGWGKAKGQRGPCHTAPNCWVHCSQADRRQDSVPLA